MTVDMMFVTGIRWYKDLMKVFNNMTYIYDPNWKPGNSAKSTFPVCFFHVKNMQEVMTSEISQKQMLFYNSANDAGKSDPSLDSGLLNVVADNIVIKPKTYKLDVVIPFRNLSLLEQGFVYNTYTAQAITTALTGQQSTLDKNIAAVSMLSTPYVQFLKTILNSLLITGTTSTDAYLDDVVLHSQDYNKESLETMWRMRHILKMKVYNSWKYKYVAINDISVTKEGTEDGVYEATLTVQEMPIVSMKSKGMFKGIPATTNNLVLEANGQMVIKTLDNFGEGLGI